MTGPYPCQQYPFSRDLTHSGLPSLPTVCGSERDQPVTAVFVLWTGLRKQAARLGEPTWYPSGTTRWSVARRCRKAHPPVLGHQELKSDISLRDARGRPFSSGLGIFYGMAIPGRKPLKERRASFGSQCEGTVHHGEGMVGGACGCQSHCT